MVNRTLPPLFHPGISPIAKRGHDWNTLYLGPVTV